MPGLVHLDWQPSGVSSAVNSGIVPRSLRSSEGASGRVPSPANASFVRLSDLICIFLSQLSARRAWTGSITGPLHPAICLRTAVRASLTVLLKFSFRP